MVVVFTDEQCLLFLGYMLIAVSFVVHHLLLIVHGIILSVLTIMINIFDFIRVSGLVESLLGDNVRC